MSFDPVHYTPDSFQKLQEAYHELSRRFDALEREAVKLRQDNSALQQTLAEVLQREDRDFVRLL